MGRKKNKIKFKKIKRIMGSFQNLENLRTKSGVYTAKTDALNHSAQLNMPLSLSVGTNTTASMASYTLYPTATCNCHCCCCLTKMESTLPCFFPSPASNSKFGISTSDWYNLGSMSKHQVQGSLGMYLAFQLFFLGGNRLYLQRWEFYKHSSGFQTLGSHKE